MYRNTPGVFLYIFGLRHNRVPDAFSCDSASGAWLRYDFTLKPN